VLIFEVHATRRTPIDAATHMPASDDLVVAFLGTHPRTKCTGAHGGLGRAHAGGFFRFTTANENQSSGYSPECEASASARFSSLWPYPPGPYRSRRDPTRHQ
jgi:hypothetical protein